MKWSCQGSASTKKKGLLGGAAGVAHPQHVEHEDPVLVLTQNNTPMMTLNMFIFERTSSSS